MSRVFSTMPRTFSELGQGGTVVVAAGAGDELQEVRAVLGVDHPRELGAIQMLHLVAEHALDRRAHVSHGGVRLHDHDHVRRVLHERAEAGLALLAQEVLRQRGALQRERDLRGEGLDAVGRRTLERDRAADGEHRGQLTLQEQR
jgi:hypothetical protein